MATNKFFKSLLFTLTIAISLFGFCVQDSYAYPVFAQQNYANPRAANGKLACANCHLNQKHTTSGKHTQHDSHVFFAFHYLLLRTGRRY